MQTLTTLKNLMWILPQSREEFDATQTFLCVSTYKCVTASLLLLYVSGYFNGNCPH